MSHPVDHPTQSVADPAATTGGTEHATMTAPSLTSPERYVLGDEIARGGMGEVYRATDTVLSREVAVKVLQAKYAPTSGTARRFADEARITGQLQHPNIPAVHDLGTLPDGRPFLAMKLIKGQTLDELLKQRTSIEQDRGKYVAVFEQICQAVAYAHAHDVIHRDLKPANVMVGAFGEVQVMDWGLAKVLRTGSVSDGSSSDPESTSAETEIKSLRDSEDLLTQAGSILGTPAYMPPEQALGAVHEIDARSDVFGLGGILAAILTGSPPFVGDTAEGTRVQAAKGKVRDCFARLDGCGADPELVALAMRCLAPEREDRPADADIVAKAVAALRSAADERARQAELEKVRVEGEKVAAEARFVERRRRRRIWVIAASVLALSVVGGLAAVLVVQDRARRDVEAKNLALAQEQAKVEAKNAALEAERAKVEQRFEMARKAIAAFHTTIDEQPELGNEAFRPLRKKLLTAAAGFYRELETLLANASDLKSRAALADGYFQLAELTEKIGDKTEALVLYRKALALRRELAATPGADADTRLAVSETLRKAGLLAANTADLVRAQRELEEAREVAAALDAEAPTDAVRRALAASHHAMGWLLTETGKSADALDSYGKSRDILRKLADARPDVARCQRDLAASHNNIGLALYRTGKPAEAMASCEVARGILEKLVAAHKDVIQYQSELAWSHNIIGVLYRQMGKLADALASYEAARGSRLRLAYSHPAVNQYQFELAGSHQNIGVLYRQMGKLADALASYEAARDLQQKLAYANPAVPRFQTDLASSHDDIGNLLSHTGKPGEALEPYQRARDIRLKLADAHPADSRHQIDLAWSHNAIANVLSRSGKTADALASYEKARDIWQKLTDAHPTVTEYQSNLANSYRNIGRLHAKAARFAEAFASLDAGLAIREKLVAADTKSTKYMTGLGYSHAYRGWAQVRAGQPKEAAADLRKALELWETTKDPDAEDRFEKSRALALLAKLGADPKSGVTADEAKAFTDQAVAALADAIKAGSNELKELKEPDFDAVRDRDDFKKLLADLEAKAPKSLEVAPPPRVSPSAPKSDK